MTTTTDDESRPDGTLSSTPDPAPTFAFPPSDEVEEAARQAALKAADNLLARQHPDGYWREFLGVNTSMDAQDSLMRQFLGILDDRTAAATGRWIRSKQLPDGSWSPVHEGAGDLGITIESYLALRLAGHDPDEPHMRQCAEWVRERGGLAAARVTTRIWCAMFGWWSWDRLYEVPPEMILLPKWAPLNVYSYLYWMRQVVVPYLVVLSHRPVAPVPFGIDELLAVPGTHAGTRTDGPSGGWDGVFRGLNRALRWYRKAGPSSVRRAAVNACLRWITERQEADGSWGGVRVQTMWSVFALRHSGYPLDHPAVRAGLGFLDHTIVWPEEGVRKVEICESPVWDTALSVIALRDTGLPGDHPALVRAADWLVGQQTTRRADWSVQRPRLATGGWAFQFHNECYPDMDDTSEVVLALHRVRHPDPARVDAAVRKGAHWNLGMQSKNGGWGAFDADSVSPIPERLALTGISFIADAPSADISGHVLEMLGALGMQDDIRTRRGIRWLLAQQEDDGSWFGRWGVNHVYGTGAAVPALIANGVPPGHPAVRRAVAWLRSVQNADGGWGEDWESYTDPRYIGHGPSTPSQTAWALTALLAAGERDSEAVRSGIRRLADTQRDDGTWDEPYHTGTVIPGEYALHYGLYAHAFPLTALGRYVQHQNEGAIAGARPGPA
ncbi:squalene-hopene cyclase [Streptomyces sp. CB02923]|uniref:squalene--hopene cyclase n=1 Tax=Streptomyces sp. CB02923 TaxID=1718985 RepID=UPI00093BD65B|nr:squalene--hopene cyclase [Streptomyces sp. CB02923]OKH99843.1 squalene-hopene cyclase [Streptomyces sp. CB02923]